MIPVLDSLVLYEEGLYLRKCCFFFCDERSMLSMGCVSMVKTLVGLEKPCSWSLLVLSLLKVREGCEESSRLLSACVWVYVECSRSGRACC